MLPCKMYRWMSEVCLMDIQFKMDAPLFYSQQIKNCAQFANCNMYIVCLLLCILGCSDNFWLKRFFVLCDTGNCGMLQLSRGIPHSQGWHCVPPPTRYTCGVQRGVCLFRYHAKVMCTLLWPSYVIGQAIIFLPCDFCLLSIFYLFSSPNLSRRRLDVYHTSTLGVALVRI